MCVGPSSPTKPARSSANTTGRFCIDDVVDDLIVGALQERRVDRAHRLDVAGRRAGRKTYRVRFGDADVEIARRERLGELGEAGAVGHRGGDADDALVARGGCDQRVGEGLRERRTAALLLEPPFVGRVHVRADAVERARIALGRLEALAFDGAHVQSTGPGIRRAFEMMSTSAS